ncbi:hypothetical protein [Arsenicicoccus bolidensis]|uniref:hypothetical protein n=1 Tax=Arsenicicoccus bolidensis TaxID=229480 RepID=UPI000553A428|nr:hypothetical protein [Arsenicicoccus bolidensis]
MAKSLDVQTTEAKARELLDNRISSVRKLVASRQALTDLREQIAAAEDDDLKAYRDALSDGWSADELRRLGLDEPDKKRRTRRRPQTQRQSSPSDAASYAEGDPQ